MYIGKDSNPAGRPQLSSNGWAGDTARPGPHLQKGRSNFIQTLGRDAHSFLLRPSLSRVPLSPLTYTRDFWISSGGRSEGSEQEGETRFK